MPLSSYDSAGIAVHAILASLVTSGEAVDPVTDPTSIASEFGKVARGTVERVADGFTLANPRARIASFQSRPLNLAFAIANTLWTLSGSNDLEAIAFYNHRGRAFSSDGTLLAGAVGKRLFDSDGGDQIAAIINRLTVDAASRRTTAVALCAQDTLVPPLDMPCSIGFQFLLRQGRLQAITFMRSQSAIGVLPYDLFLFTMLHESVAVALGVPLGPYHHLAGSLHYYQNEADAVRSAVGQSQPSIEAMPAMTAAMLGPNAPSAQAEARIREKLAKDPSAAIDLREHDLDEYWTGLFLALLVGTRRSRGGKENPAEVAGVPPLYRGLLEKWVTR